MYVCLNSGVSTFAVPPGVPRYTDVWGEMINITKDGNIQSAK